MKKKPLRLSVYVPLCSQRCSYCGRSVFKPTLKTIRDYAEALLREVRAVDAEEMADYRVESLRFTGGAPTFLPIAELARLYKALLKRFDFAPEAELSMDIVPGHLSEQHCRLFKSMGLERLSIQFATGDPREHKLLGRPYGFDRGLETETLTFNYPPRHLDLCLLTGFPTQTPESFLQSLRSALAWKGDHISLIPLSPCPGTPLAARWETGMPAPSRQALHSLARELLTPLGFAPYGENYFAKPGAQSRDKLLALSGAERLEFGLGARSCLDGILSENCRDMQRYLRDAGNIAALTASCRPAAGREDAAAFLEGPY